MFERYISDVLTSYFGQYIQDIDIEQIRISAWRGGAIVLHNVQLRPDCIQHFFIQQQQRQKQTTTSSTPSSSTTTEHPNVSHNTIPSDHENENENEEDEVLFPIEMIYGHIGRLELRIPWKVVRNQLLLSSSSRSTTSTTTSTSSKSTHPTKKPVTTSNSSNSTSKDSNNNNNNISILLCDVNILLAPIQPKQPPKTTSSKRPRRPVPTGDTTILKEEIPSSNLKDTFINEDTNDVDNNKNDDDISNNQKNASNILQQQSILQQQQQQQHEQSIQAALDAELLQRIAVSSTTTSSTTTTSQTTNVDTLPTTQSWKQRVFERTKSIFSNLSVTIQNIHIRYEDPGYGFISSNATTGSRYHHPTTTNVQSIPEEEVERWQHHHHSYTYLPKYRPSFAIGITLREFTIQQSSSSMMTKNVITTTTTAAATTKKVVIAAAHDVATYWDNDVVLIIMTSRMEKSITSISDAFHELNMVNTDHSYVLDPFSPSIEFGLLPSPLQQLPTTTMTSELDHTCNTMDITFPPCRWNVSKNLMDDIKYLRRSISKFQSQQQQRQPVRDIQHLLYPIRHLRPHMNSSSSPRHWWHYSYAAVTLLIHHSDHTESNISPHISTVSNHIVQHPSHDVLIRPRGWIGLAQALGRRNQYLHVYLNFLRHYNDDTNGKMQEYHEELLTMERQLLVNEVKSFRIALYEHIHDIHHENKKLWLWIQSLIADQDSDDSSHGGNDSSSALLGDDRTTTLLSAEHRFQMFIEMAAVLHRERNNIELQRYQSQLLRSDVTGNASTSLSNDQKRLVWKIGLKCVEFSLQVNDTNELVGKKNQRSIQTIPVVRLSCAFIQSHDFFQCGSWSMSVRIGSLFVKDCTVTSTNDVDMSSTQFPNLMAMKISDNTEEIKTNDTFDIDGIVHTQIIGVEVKRVKSKMRDEIMQSRTETYVRVLPLEIVYTTAPVESLSHIFGTTNEEFSDDYNRIVNRLSIWKNRQQKRLLNALAHKQKQIYFDVLIGAPVLLVPVGRRSNDSLLIFDLGQLHFCSMNGNTGRLEYDNQWLLEMTHVQIKSMPVMTYVSRCSIEEESRYVVEPFSLRFDIFTKIQNDTSETVDEQSSVLALANLPRLALNVNSTDVVHFMQLQTQWTTRKKERQPLPPIGDHSTYQTSVRDDKKLGEDVVLQNVKRRFEFRFVAPIFSVRFETKSNRLDNCIDCIPLFDFALKGIEGSMVRTLSAQCTDTTFCAKVRGLIAVDLFQPAGIEYSILLSSINPEILQGISSVSSFPDKYLSGDHLVTFEYSLKLDRQKGSSVRNRSSKNDEESNCLKVVFHELFVEWNPETIAMISAAIWTSSEETNIEKKETVPEDLHKDHINTSQNEDEFFDAEEDAFYDAESVASVDGASRLLSEISESERSSVSDFNVTSYVGSMSPWSGAKGPLPVFARPTIPGSPWSLRSFLPPTNPNSSVSQSQFQQFVVGFELSKLRVNFNKESRHRRLITAEMDRTKVHYTRMTAGGSKITFNIGNLTFSDSESVFHNTLYREILGLKTDESGNYGEQSSLLEMEMITKPRARKFVTLDEISDDVAASAGLPVFVDSSKGLIYGFDNYFQATLSPMRFVYLQQLWFEIVDYFFTAIVGYEVWGNKTPIPGDTRMLEGKSIGADAIPFTRFDIILKSPTILFPVSPCSTDFIRITTSFISLRNWYSFDSFRPPTLYFRLDGETRQWYNNCDIKFEEIEICSWSGSVLNLGECRPSSKLSVSWPVGPCAPVNVPKWNVVCVLDETHFILDRVDYALLQHVIQHNLGSASLHMDEWDLFQRLDAKSKTTFNKNLLVHFPYDKKDSTPSTFDMTLTIPKVSTVLTQGKGRDIAVVRCTNVQWKYCKLLDRLSRQNVTCNVDIVDSILCRALLSSDEHGELSKIGALPEMEYISCTFPSSKNEKTLRVKNACVDIIFQSWMNLSSFFQDLPLPAYLSPKEAIQVGDRWYKIGDQPTHNVIDKRLERLNWIRELGPVANPEIAASHTITATSTFHFLLIKLAIQVRSGVSALILSLENLDFLQSLCTGTRNQTLKLVGLEFQTRQSMGRRNSDFSVIRPWNIEAVLSSGQQTNSCTCVSNACTVNADVLYARTAYSDITVALDACINLFRDIKAASNSRLPAGTRLYGGSQSTGSKSRKIEVPRDVKSTHNRQISIVWKGISFVLVDDSGRHFLRDQNLAHVTSQMIDFSWRNNAEPCTTGSCMISSAAATDLNMRLQIMGFNVIDCLQSNTSPFREVLSMMSQTSTTSTSVTNNFDDSTHKKLLGFEIWSRVRESKYYGIAFPDVAIQYNPSFVVALQRFLGRLSKEIKKDHGDIFQELTHNVAEKTDDASLQSSPNPNVIYRLSVSIPRIHIQLNKEHQNRRLLSMSISGIQLESNFSETYSTIKGHVCNFSATDPMRQGNGLAEVVVRSATGESRFVQFVYMAFFNSKSNEGIVCNDLPPWVQSMLTTDDKAKIDDMLDVTIGNHEMVYIADRTAELLDYLSNGMPGKGMGVTSRAAKGFVDKRILRRTFATIQIGIPRIMIPSCQGNDINIEVRLGDLTLQSWIGMHDHSAQSRLIKLLLNKCSIILNKEAKNKENSVRRPLMDDLDFEVDIEISDIGTIVRCTLSTVLFRLSYRDYLSLQDVARHNLGKKSDKRHWDNLERAWAKESDDADAVQEESSSNSMKLLYSSSARVIRYGQSKGVGTKLASMKAAIKLGSVGLVLRRDDTTHITGSSYDMIGIRGEGFECEFGIREDGEQWFHLSLRSIFVVDLGRMGRRLRYSHTAKVDLQRTNTLGVLVAGYNSIVSQKSDDHEEVDSQLVFKAEREASTGNINLVIVISFISVTAFVEPLQDLINFITSKWNESSVVETTASNLLLIRENPNDEESAELRARWISAFRSKLNLRFVSHYARFVFAADEMDAQSRCLIVRGLSIANVSLLPKIDNYSLTVNMDFQDVSSHMNPDISDIACIRSEHIPSLVGILSNDAIELLDQKFESSNDDFSTPLLLPLTLSIDYEQETKPQEPMLRSLAISVDPISVLFSNDDLKLVRAIIDGWTLSARKEKTLDIEGRHFYEVTFTSERLGLGLRKEAGQIIVDNVAELKHHDSIQTGDSLFAVNGHVISDIATISLNEMVSRLSSTPRPLTVTFLRVSRKQIDSVDENEIYTLDSSTKVGTNDKINISISSAVITVVEREVPLIKVAISMTKIACNIMRSKGTAIRLEASSSTNIDYYNLKIWGWEPFIDPGIFYLSLSFQDVHHGPRELAIEMGDKESGFSINLTDSFIDTISKLLDWRSGITSEANEPHRLIQTGVPDDDGSSARDVSVDAATNAAFHFAARQKSGATKPFEFRNRTGVSVAFARHKTPQKQVRSNEPLNYVGEYNGLQRYQTSDITVVSNGEDVKFRIDVNSFADKKDSSSHAGRFPSFIVALQTTAGVSVEPFESLETSRPGEMLLPVLFGKGTSTNWLQMSQVRRWATWSVEQLNERTIVTIGSSIRVVSMLSRIIEVGISAASQSSNVLDNAGVMLLGTLREGIPFNIPLWIAMQKQNWHFYVKLGGDFFFTPIFSISQSGVVNLQRTVSGCIECHRSIGTEVSEWLAVSLLDEGGLSLISIDCTVSIRNLLPISIEWEIGQDLTQDADFTDGSSIRSQSLSSGEEVEVLTNNFQTAKIRLCPTQGNFMWSSWLALALPGKRENTKQEGKSGEENGSAIQEDSYTTVNVKDVFHVNLPLGLRISSRARGIDVTLYSDLWCTNSTSLNLIFGLPTIHETQVDPMKALSVGEATLKEISSLFESGEFTRKFEMSSRGGLNDVIRIPGQVSSHITEECFEYVEVERAEVISRWWASENPFASREYIMGSDQEQCKWIDKTWKVDSFGRTADGWESSADLDPFLPSRIFNASHRYRRRRWSRTRHGMSKNAMVNGVDAFVHLPREMGPVVRDGKTEHSLQLAIQVNGGRWSQISAIPRQGSFHGVVRVSKSRWLFAEGESHVADKTVYELCYVVAPLDGDWGLLTRSLIVTSRFLLRNDSKGIAFEVKQTGASDSSSVIIQPGEMLPFHWGSYHLPELVSVRPVTIIHGRCIYKWSGGFDPLLIGHVPLRLRKIPNAPDAKNVTNAATIHSLKVEIEIRPRTGGTGINLVFQEEDTMGEGALFRIENLSPFPIWFCQDDVLANPSKHHGTIDYSDIANPSSSVVFSLDIPFRQGKYSHRKAAALTTLLRVRLALAPLATRAGIETTKVLSMAIGETVRLNPSKLMILNPEIRHVLQDVRIVGVVINDGPTRVLRLRITSQSSSDIEPWPNLNSMTWHDDLPFAFKAIVHGAGVAAEMRKTHTLPSESEIKLALQQAESGSNKLNYGNSSDNAIQSASRNLIVSFRAAFSGLTVSLIDAAPSEIAVATFKNINALATWDTLRVSDSTIYVTVTSLQVDNMVPNSPFPVAVCPFDQPNHGRSDDNSIPDTDSPLLVVGISFAPRHKSGILCLKSATIAPRNLAIKVDLAFLVRLQKYFLDMMEHFNNDVRDWGGRLQPPDIDRLVNTLNAASQSGVDSQKIYFGGLTILPCNIKLSVAPARALTPAQAALEGPEIAAIHQAVRKGDVRVDKKSAGILGVKIGSRNKTPLAVVRGLFKSFIVDGFLRLDGASLNFSGVSLRYHTSTTSQLTTALTAHYLASLRQNLPAVLGSLAAFGNPLGLVRGLGEGVGDFVLEPVRGFQRSVQEMDASYLVDGVARGTLSLTRHTVGGFADSAAMIAETFSKNMAVLTLDRKYAQKRDRGEIFREYDDINVASGLGSGVQKLVNGFMEGVTGVVRAPIRGAEKHGLEGFAKGIGKGLLGLLVKPIIGISDGFSDVMIGVKGSVEGGSAGSSQQTQVRPRRALYGREKAIRTFNFPDAAASALMLRTRLASEPYLSHLDLGDRVILLSCKRGVMLGRHGEELLVIKLKQIENVEIRGVTNEDGSIEWGVVIVLDTPSPNGNDVEVIVCKEKSEAEQLYEQFNHGKDVASNP